MGQKDPTYRDKYQHYVNFIERTFPRKVAITLAGDLHHYRRHEQTSDATTVLRQKITAGGGGAFLHPTHGPDVSVLENGYALKAAFPSATRSFWLTFRNLAFPIINPKFGAATAVVYLLLVWSVRAPITQYHLREFAEAFWTVIGSVLKRPGAAFWPFLFLSGFWLFTDTHRRSYRFIAGSIHAATHITAAFLLYWCAVHGNFGAWSTPLILLGGYLAGSSIMGIYLLISLNIFHRHSNEAFSSLAIRDWKNFLRIKIDADGVTIYPIGIRRVSRRWRKSGHPSVSELLPDDGRATAPELIEPPVVVLKT
jgi:hypothetical protein